MLLKQAVLNWVEAFNRQDVEHLMSMYAPDAVSYQIIQPPASGHEQIRQVFVRAFAVAEMIVTVERIIEDGEWVAFEWRDPLGLRGCSLFQFRNGLIAFQRGYWDKLTFCQLYGVPLDMQAWQAMAELKTREREIREATER